MKNIFFIISFYFMFTFCFAQSVTKVEHTEKIDHYTSVGAVTDLGYMQVHFPNTHNFIKTYYFKINDKKNDSVLVELPPLKDSLNYMFLIRPFKSGIFIKLFDADSNKQIGTNFFNGKYYEGCYFIHRTDKNYKLYISINDDFPEEKIGKLFRFDLIWIDKSIKDEEIPKQEKSNQKKKKGKKRN